MCREEVLRIKQLVNEYKKSNLNRKASIQQIKAIIESSQNEYVRFKGLKALGKLKPTEKKYFDFLENYLISDESDLIRAETAKILLLNYPDLCIKPIKWVIENDIPKPWKYRYSEFLLREIVLMLDSNQDKPYNNILKDAFNKEYYDNYDVFGHEYFEFIYKLKTDYERLEMYFELDLMSLIRTTKNVYIKAEYIKALGTERVKDKEAFSFLEEILQTENDIIVREAVKKAILHDFPSKDIDPLEWRKHLDTYFAQIHVREGVIPSEAQLLGELGQMTGYKLTQYHKHEEYKSYDNMIYGYRIDSEGHVIGFYVAMGEPQFKNIPEQICSLKHLEKLEMYDEGMKSIPECIGKLKKLRKLQLVGNYIKELPASFKTLTQLELIDLSSNYGNPIEIPEYVKEFKAYKKKSFYVK